MDGANWAVFWFLFLVFSEMSRERERELDEQIEKLESEVADLDRRLRHEREKLADIELFIAGGALDPMKPATFR